MKKNFILIVAAICVIASAQAAMASYQITTGSFWGPYHPGGSGEVTVEPNPSLDWVLGSYTNVTSGYWNGSSSNTFQTFCLEFNEYIDLSTTYNAELSTEAVKGGYGGGSPDPLSIGTAYLYSKFVAGTLAGYGYNSANRGTQDAVLLQRAIWMLEDEISWNASNPFIGVVLAKYVDETGAKANSNGAFGVRVLNLTLDNNDKQDVTTVVPIPGAVWLLGSGLLGLLGIRRKVVG